MTNNVNPKAQIEEMLKRAKERKAAAEAEKVQAAPVRVEKPAIIPSVQAEEPEEDAVHLPTEFSENSNGMSLLSDLVISKDKILKSLAPDPEKYNLDLTAEEAARIKRSLGRMTTGSSAVIPLVCRGEACSFSSKCVHEDTEVLSNVGSSVIKIKDLRVAQEIYSVDSDNIVQKDKVVCTERIGKKNCYTVVTASKNEVTVTVNHPFNTYNTRTKESKWLNLAEILPIASDICLLVTEPKEDMELESFGDLFQDPIFGIKAVGLRTVYDVTVQTNSNFIGNNFSLHNCPFYNENKVTIGEDCLVETSLIEYWTERYMSEFDIDMASITELHTISRLVEITIKEQRMNLYMSIHDQDLMQDFVSGTDERGNEITNKGVSTAHTVREQLDKSKIKLLETLNATREKKAKLKLGAMQTVGATNSAAGLAGLRTVLENLAEKMADQNNSRIVNK